MDDLPSTERGPRQSDNESQTGTGAPRSADGSVRNKSNPTERQAADQTALDELHVNRSGSGGSGGSGGAEDSEGSTGASMDELLGGEPDEPSRG